MALKMASAQAGKTKWVSREARLREIISAAADSIARVGFADTTLATVAREAGMSPASLVFYFETKDALLTETLRQMAEQFTENWKTMLARAPDDPVARLVVMVKSSFSPKVCSQKSIAIWHAFYGEAKTRPAYLKICGEHDEERYEALREVCAAVLEADGKSTDGAVDLSILIDALSDGLWVDILTSAGATNRREALRLAIQHLKTLFPEHAADIADWDQKV
jgi:TetR/AcrR family transcriptional repressor of bet genes